MAEHMLILGIENPEGRDQVCHRRHSRPRAARPTSPCSFRRTATARSRLQGLVRRRRYRLAAHRPGRQTVGRQPRERLLRRRSRHQREVQPERAAYHEAATPSSRTLCTTSTTTPSGGKASTTIRRRTRIDWKGNTWDYTKYDKNDKSTCGAHPNSRFTATGEELPLPLR